MALCRSPARGSRLVASDGASRGEKGRVLVAYQTEAIGELLGELPRGRRTPCSIFLIVSTAQ